MTEPPYSRSLAVAPLVTTAGLPLGLLACGSDRPGALSLEQRSLVRNVCELATRHIERRFLPPGAPRRGAGDEYALLDCRGAAERPGGGGSDGGSGVCGWRVLYATPGFEADAGVAAGGELLPPAAAAGRGIRAGCQCRAAGA